MTQDMRRQPRALAFDAGLGAPLRVTRRAGSPKYDFTGIQYPSSVDGLETTRTTGMFPFLRDSAGSSINQPVHRIGPSFNDDCAVVGCYMTSEQREEVTKAKALVKRSAA